MAVKLIHPNYRYSVSGSFSIATKSSMTKGSGTMDEKWSRKFENCQNCMTTRFKHAGRGYCTRCYRLIKKLEDIVKWDLHDVATLKGCQIDPSNLNLIEFESVRNQYKVQIEKRLFCLWAKEEKLGNFIKGIDIAYSLDRIAKRCRVRADKHFKGAADLIDENFNAEQRKILFKLLNDIEENIQTRIAIQAYPNQIYDPLTRPDF